MRLNTVKIMNKVWTKELLFDILMMFNTIWQDDMSNKYNENNASMSHSDCRAPVLPSPDAVSDPRKNTRFCVNPTRFSLFFERRRGWGKEVFC